MKASVTTSIPRHTSHLILSVALAATSLKTVPAWADSDTPVRAISGDFQRLRGQWTTKGKSAELALPGGGRVRVRENTDASILTEPQSLTLPPGKKITTYTVILRRGLVEVELPESTESRLAISIVTPTEARFITLSGRSSVGVSGRTVSATSYSGVTTVYRGTKLTRLPEGAIRQFRPNGVVAERPLLDAAKWVGGPRVWVTPADSLAHLGGYVWSPVEGADGYFVVLRKPATNDTLFGTLVTSPIIEQLSSGLGPGEYELCVTAVDREGFFSPKRTSVPIHVVGVQIPGGATLLPKDTVQLAPEQRVRLTHAGGLTLTTADHRSNVSASEPFGLEGLDRAVILIHPKGGGDAVPLVLVRRQPSVSAWVGPKLATWPGDPVDLQVSFVDDRGQPTPSEIHPTVRVTVGTEAVDVNWKKQGNLWQAKLQSPTKGKGPWVVRLEITDQHGSVIGRDFAEITKTRQQSKYLEGIDDGQATATAMAPIETQ